MRASRLAPVLPRSLRRRASHRAGYLVGPLAPAVKGRVVAGIPALAEAGSAQIPVGADLARHGTQVVPEVDERRTTPKPVAVVDRVDDEPRLEHERVRDHRIVLGVGVLLDVQILLDDPSRVAEE